MLINIITPCSRPENLKDISESINIPRANYRWIVVFDAYELPTIKIPNNAECYIHRNNQSTAGHAQRNFANTLIRDGYVVQLDDDTIMHPNFWQEVREYTHDIISWKQSNKDGTHRLDAGIFKSNQIDSGSFMVKRSVIDDILWNISAYGADGLFAEEIIKKTNSQFSIDKYLSFYNYMR